MIRWQYCLPFLHEWISFPVFIDVISSNNQLEENLQTYQYNVPLALLCDEHSFQIYLCMVAFWIFCIPAASVLTMLFYLFQGNSYSVFLEWNCWSFWCRQTRYRLVAGSCGCSVIGCTYRNKIVMLAPFNCLFLDKLFRHGDTSLILTVMEGSDLVNISERSADQVPDLFEFSSTVW